MFSFCPNCGRSPDQEQLPGQTIVCKHCGHRLGVVPLPEKAIVVDRTEELIRSGAAARCPLCNQTVEVKAQSGAKTFVPHFATGPPRKMCPNSGKPLAPPPPAAPSVPLKTPLGKDLSAYMTRDLVRVVSCAKTAEPLIEELTLEYLDKKDRVRLQIEALRELLGPAFQMKTYPPTLARPDLAVWGNATACVIAKRHPQGGYQPLTEAEVRQVLDDLGSHKQLFFA